KQNIAVTGSINQKGQVQVVGGITRKVEGFYYCCKNKGLTGDQGVIIPANNEDNLVLCQEVQDAIKTKKFHIYKVNKVEEAMEILTDEKFDTIKKLSMDKLAKYSQCKNKEM
ncbi:MAG: S16 family serine protease, partial [Intestinibacter sp.]|uniref:S16 family serine protease n=1 Tax=Intestinibacter sp. TaxID=1965304 RepID=UPI003F17D23E